MVSDDHRMHLLRLSSQGGPKTINCIWTSNLVSLRPERPSQEHSNTLECFSSGWEPLHFRNLPFMAYYLLELALIPYPRL